MRLTEWRGEHAAIANHHENYIDKLAAYEDAEEQESIGELHTEQIRCKRCKSIDCHGCNLFSLSQMLEDGKLNEMMGEDHKIKTDLSVRPVVFCSECEHRLMHKFPYNYGEVLACNDPHYATIRAVNPMHFCSYGKHKEGEEAKH